jgi:hypothetical protein
MRKRENRGGTETFTRSPRVEWEAHFLVGVKREGLTFQLLESASRKVTSDAGDDN